MAMKKAHKDMLKGAGVLVAISVFMKEKFDEARTGLERTLGRS